ncbi:hypothetical protein ACLOAV_006109 [Pseudogymnoascus australis]
MDLRVLRRPIFDLLAGRGQCLLSGTVSSRRNESSYRRMKKKLNVKPDASFGFSKDSPATDHIIFNPPSSAPSVLHTPLKFLPKEDKRRQLYSVAKNSTLGIDEEAKLPPAILKQNAGYQRYHLTQEDVAEIRRLRSSDPETWTRLKLARKFNCTSLFIGICCEATAEKVALEKAKIEAVKERWGPKRRMARDDRVKRREAAYRDE